MTAGWSAAGRSDKGGDTAWALEAGRLALAVCLFLEASEAVEMELAGTEMATEGAVRNPAAPSICESVGIAAVGRAGAAADLERARAVVTLEVAAREAVEAAMAAWRGGALTVVEEGTMAGLRAAACSEVDPEAAALAMEVGE